LSPFFCTAADDEIESVNGVEDSNAVSSAAASLFLQENKRTENTKVMKPNFEIVCIEN
jgi:hypothetical protein